MKKDDLFRVRDIRYLCDSIINPPAGDYDRIGYMQASLSEIGRSADRLSGEFRDATRDEVMWGFVRALSGMTGIRDEQTTLEIVKHDIPALQNFCERILDKCRDSKEHKRSNDDLSR